MCSSFGFLSKQKQWHMSGGPHAPEEGVGGGKLKLELNLSNAPPQLPLPSSRLLERKTRGVSCLPLLSPRSARLLPRRSPGGGDAEFPRDGS